MNGKYKRLFSDTLLFAISNFGSKIMTFLLMPLYTYILTTGEYGTADIVTTSVNLLAPVLTLSISEATLRFALDKKNDPGKVLCNSLLLLAAAFILVLAATPVAYFIGGNIWTYWWCFVAVYTGVILQMCLSNYLKGCGKTKLFAIQGCLYTLVLIICNILFLVYFKHGLYGYLYSMAVANAVSCLFMCITGKIFGELRHFKSDKQLLKQMISYSAPMMLTSIAWWINASADKYMLIGMVGVAANGLYAVAHKIPTIFSTLTGLLSQAWRISAISNYDEADKEEYYSNMCRYYMLVCTYACLGITVFTQLIAKILFSADFYDAWMFVPPLLLSAVFEAYAGFLASIYAAASKTKILSVSTCIGAAVNIVLNFILINALGIMGAPIATFTSFIVVCVVRTVLIKKHIKLTVPYGRLVTSFALLIVGNMIYAYNVPYKYLWYIATALTIAAINAKDTLYLLKNILRLFKKAK